MGGQQRGLGVLHLGRVQLHPGLPDLHAVRVEAEGQAADLQKVCMWREFICLHA